VSIAPSSCSSALPRSAPDRGQPPLRLLQLSSPAAVPRQVHSDGVRTSLCWTSPRSQGGLAMSVGNLSTRGPAGTGLSDRRGRPSKSIDLDETTYKRFTAAGQSTD
jgi:hypothetical protein